MRAGRRPKFIAVGWLGIALLTGPASLHVARAQFVDDGSDANLSKAETQAILDLIRANVKEFPDAKVTSLRRSKGSIVCGSLNVKNKDGLYLGERGFVVDLAKPSFGRVPEGPELMNPRAQGFEDKERIRALYFDMCLD